MQYPSIFGILPCKASRLLDGQVFPRKAWNILESHVQGVTRGHMFNPPQSIPRLASPLKLISEYSPEVSGVPATIDYRAYYMAHMLSRFTTNTKSTQEGKKRKHVQTGQGLLKRNFSSSVSSMTSGTSKASCSHLVKRNGTKWPKCNDSEDGPRPV